MPLEQANYIHELVESNPVGSTDLVSEGDDHLRMIKRAVKGSFPEVKGEVTASHTELNYLDGATGVTGSGDVVLSDGAELAGVTVQGFTASGPITLAGGDISDYARLSQENTFDFIRIHRAATSMQEWRRTTAEPDHGSWQLRIGPDGALRIEAMDDAGQSLGNALRVERDATGVTRTVIYGDVRLGEDLWADDIARLSGRNVFTANQSDGLAGVTVAPDAGDNAGIALVNSAAPEGERRWVLRALGGVLRLGPIADTGGSSPNHGLVITRDGTGVDHVLISSNEIELSGEVTATSYAGDGSGLTNLDASELTGTVPGELLGGNQTMAGDKTFTGAVTVQGVVTAGRAPRSTSSTLSLGAVHARSANTTIPQGTAGGWTGVYNDSASDITLTEDSGLTLRLGGTEITGNRTLAPRGMAVVWYNSATEAVAVGMGVS